MITNDGNNLIFLLGLPRSGTTLLSAMLDRHPQVACPPEPWMMLALHATGTTSAHHPADAPVLWRAFREFSVHCDTTAAARAFAQSVYNARLTSAGKKIFVDKTPRYYHILDYVAQVFPAARYVWLVRNPLDVAASVKTSWKSDLPHLLKTQQDHLAAIDFVVGLSRLRRFTAAHDVIRIRYEDLVRDPQAGIEWLMSQLSLASAPGLVDIQVGGDSAFASSIVGDRKIRETSGVHQQSIDTWRSTFTTDELQTLLDAIGSETMRDLGYADSLQAILDLGVADNGADIANSHRDRLEACAAERFTIYDKTWNLEDIIPLERSLHEVLSAGQSELPPDLRTRVQSNLEYAAKLREELARKGQEMDQLYGERHHLKNLSDAMINETTQLRDQATQLRAEIEQLRTETAKLQTELTAAQEQCRTAEESLTQANAQLDEKKQELKRTVDGLKISASQLAHQRDRVRSLEELLEQAAASAATALMQRRREQEEAGRLLQDARERLHAAHAQLHANNEAARAIAKSAEMNYLRLRSYLTSKYVRAGWALRVIPKPAWAAEVLDNPPAPDRFNSEPAIAASNGGVAAESLPHESEELLQRTEEMLRARPEEPDDMVKALHHLALDKGFHPRIVLDIGAAKGWWSLKAGWFFKEAQFYMIDPLEESEPNLKETCEKDPRFHYILSAIGAEPGSAMINVGKDTDASSLLAWPNNAPERQRVVTVETIDRLIEQGRIPPPDLVKIDVQGFEMKVLQGGAKMFDSAEVFIIEVSLFEFVPGHAVAQDVIVFMSQRGYRLFDIAGRLRRPLDDDLGQMDLIFVSAKSEMIKSNRWA